MNLFHLVYYSKPFGFDLNTLHGILLTSQANNFRDNITGSLLCRADIYLQLLEGPIEKVEQAFNRIKDDDRHLEVKCLLKEKTNERLFPSWAMKDDPVKTWMWTKNEIDSGIIEKLPKSHFLRVFKKVAELSN